MKVFAYAAASFGQSVRIAAGIRPLTCPPMNAEHFDPIWLQGCDFLYFKLHGMPDQPYWYGDEFQTALTAKQIQRADLSGAVVFVANCYLADSPMLAALLDSGARAVIGGHGKNYARSTLVDGADMLGMWLRRMLRLGIPLEAAFRIAKKRISLERTVAGRDTLAFQLFKKKAKTYAPGSK